MQIQIQYHFYLDYELPDIDKPLQLTIENADFIAHVEGWDRTEQLFFDPIGETLSTMEFSISPHLSTQGQLVRRVKDLCIDRLRVVLAWDTDNAPTGDAATQKLWLEHAVDNANFILGHLRAAADSFRIRRIPRYWRPGHSEFAIQIPYTVAWINSSDSTQIPQEAFSGANATCSAGAVIAPYTGQVSFQEFATSISTGVAPVLHRTLLVDAAEALARLGVRESILSAASACESRINIYATSQSALSSSQVKTITKGSLPFADRFFDNLPSAVCQRSLKLDDLVTFTDIGALYRERNSLMHGGNHTEAFQKMNELDRHHLVLQWIKSARAAVSWVDSL